MIEINAAGNEERKRRINALRYEWNAVRFIQAAVGYGKPLQQPFHSLHSFLFQFIPRSSIQQRNPLTEWSEVIHFNDFQQ